jgi:hypothetical protein
MVDRPHIANKTEYASFRLPWDRADGRNEGALRRGNIPWIDTMCKWPGVNCLIEQAMGRMMMAYMVRGQRVCV